MKKSALFTILFFFTLFLHAGAIKDRFTSDISPDNNTPQPGPTVPQDEAVSDLAAADTPSRAEQVMKAFSQAYPDRMGPAVYRNGDWAVFLGGEYFYYAEGRLLPEGLINSIAEYSGIPFYNYTADLPAWNPPTPEESARMRIRMEERQQPRQTTIRRPQYFFEALWRIHDRDESWERVKQIRFLGYPVMLHYSILSQLSLVEERILAESRTNSAVRQWIDSIGTVTGWNWRNISATESRSFHSYGAAIDILPKSSGGREIYWQWTAQHTPDWWTIPYSRRYHPPLEVIRAFEAFGFVWGGKWMFYDTMHFEYRPEIIFMSDIRLLDHRDIFNRDVFN